MNLLTLGRRLPAAGQTAPRPAATPATAPTARRWPAWAARAALAAVLVAYLPGFLRMGVDSDISLWDVSARTVLHGGVAYRDVAENNLPGMLWLHLAVRSLAGWSSEALRLADVLVLAAVVALLLRWLPARSDPALAPATAAVLFGFYLSTSEWCHCQRDTWMLLPALLALGLRGRQVERLSEGARGGFGRAFVEGLCWGAAVWIKPFVVVPALLCWVTSVALCRGRSLAIDLAGLLCGGVLAGAVGVCWLWLSGAWPSFVAIVFGWNRSYVAGAFTGDRLAFVAGVLVRFFPWVLVHLIGVPVALGELRQALAGSRPRLALPAALYLGWLIQAFCLQQVFDYVHAPAILLGLALVAARWPGLPPLSRRAAVVFVVACLATQHHLLAQRLDQWVRCVREDNSAELRDRLTLNDRINWRELEQVAAFLRGRGVGDGELTCYTVRTVPLYLMLGRSPSTRFVALESSLVLFRGQRGLIRAELAASRQKYVVCDLYWMRREEAELIRPEGRARAVLNTGRYVVLRLDAADTPAWLAASFGL